MFVALFSTLNPGDEVIAADPHYRVYDEVIAMCGATVRIIPTVVETGFQIDTDALEAAITPRTRAILVVSPDNPTGSVQNRADGGAHCGDRPRARSTRLLRRTLRARSSSMRRSTSASPRSPGMHERTITINGFSKAYAMTGWRVGLSGVPGRLKPAMTTVKHATRFAPRPPRRSPRWPFWRGHGSRCSDDGGVDRAPRLSL